MTIKPDDMVSIRETEPGIWETVLWTPSGLPTVIYEGPKIVAQGRANRVGSVMRQWARVLKNVEEVH